MEVESVIFYWMRFRFQ